MFEVLDVMDGQGVADALDANRRVVLGRQAFEMRLVAGWADLYGPDTVPRDGRGRVLPGMEQAKLYGGAGTPEVGEFATAELALLLGVPPQTADNLVRDALDLRHRHPALWARIMETSELADPALDPQVSDRIDPVEVWQARKVAFACHTADLSLEQAKWVDEVTTPLLGRLPWGRFQKNLDAAIIEVDPGAAEARAKADALRQHVTLGRSTEHGLITMIIAAQAGDLITAKAFIDRLAEILALEGDADPVNVRQARAASILLGIPYHACALLLRHTAHTDTDTEPEGTAGTAGTKGDGDGSSNPIGGIGDQVDRRPVDERKAASRAACWPDPPQHPPEDRSPSWPPPDSGSPDDPWAGLPPPAPGGGAPLPVDPPADQLSAWDLHPRADDADEPCPHCDGTGHAATDPGPPAEAELVAALADAIRAGKLNSDKLVPNATLYVHLSAHALWHAVHPDLGEHADEPCPHCAAGEPVPAAARVEGRIGPALLDQVKAWLGHRRVAVKPVVDLNENHAVDCHEVPAWMAEAVHLANPASAWPFSANTGRGKDKDHTIEFAVDEDGSHAEKGQTREDNLGGLERRTHRVKTHGKGWRVHQPTRGVYLWRSPHGYWYRVDNTGSRRLGRDPDLTEHGMEPRAA